MEKKKEIIEKLVTEYKEIYSDNISLKGCYPVFDERHDSVSMFISGNNPIYDGLELNYYEYDSTFEVIEYQAGKNKDELRIYSRTKSLKIALKSLIKGNKGRKTIEKW